MRESIHPAYNALEVTCSCGNKFITKSTIAKEALQIEVCSQCHPFFTGKQRLVDSAGRVDKFRQKYASFTKRTETKSV